MKFLFDIFPVILFFAAFKGAEYFPDGALSLASSFMGDGVTATTAPVFIATVTAILATILQVGWLKLKGAKVEAYALDQPRCHRGFRRPYAVA